MTWSYPPERTQLLWIAVDFDGTLCHSQWTPERPEYEIGEPIWENIAKALEVHAARLQSDCPHRSSLVALRGDRVVAAAL
jgi:hypothetical protein